MNQTQMRSELIARIFAETGVKDLFRKMFELMVKYQDKERIVMINNQYVPVKPTEWKDRFNISIVVGLRYRFKRTTINYFKQYFRKTTSSIPITRRKRDANGNFEKYV